MRVVGRPNHARTAGSHEMQKTLHKAELDRAKVTQAQRVYESAGELDRRRHYRGNMCRPIKGLINTDQLAQPRLKGHGLDTNVLLTGGEVPIGQSLDEGIE